MDTAAQSGQNRVFKGSAKFEEWWSAIPPTHRESKRECYGIWRRMKCEAVADQIITAMKDQLTWPKYHGDSLKFLKRAPSWLRKSRWEDERPPEAPARRKGEW